MVCKGAPSWLGKNAGTRSAAKIWGPRKEPWGHDCDIHPILQVALQESYAQHHLRY